MAELSPKRTISGLARAEKRSWRPKRPALRPESSDLWPRKPDVKPEGPDYGLRCLIISLRNLI